MSTKNSPIPPAAQRVLDFFDNELVDARFPDVDQGLLQEAADRVIALAEEVSKAEAALAAAQRALQEGQDALVGKCQRALAYARIYAEEDGDLSRRLEAISLPRVSKGAAGSRKDARAVFDNRDAPSLVPLPGKAGRGTSASPSPHGLRE